MSGRGGSVATTVTDAICASESLSRAPSLLLCAVWSGEVRLFLRKSRVGSDRPVYTRSEHAVVGFLYTETVWGEAEGFMGEKLKMIHRNVLIARWDDRSFCPFKIPRLSSSPGPTDATGNPLAGSACAANWPPGKGVTQVKV